MILQTQTPEWSKYNKASRYILLQPPYVNKVYSSFDSLKIAIGNAKLLPVIKTGQWSLTKK